jgi:hypothetical protein
MTTMRRCGCALMRLPTSPSAPVVQSPASSCLRFWILPMAVVSHMLILLRIRDQSARVIKAVAVRFINKDYGQVSKVALFSALRGLIPKQ